VNSPLRSCPSVGAPSGAMLLPYFKGAKGFHSPPATESLFFAWPKKSNQKNGHPTLAPYAQSLCSRCARLLRGSLTVHPWTDIELAHIVWAILRTTPAQPRRDRGDPLSAHRARQSEEQSHSHREPESASSWLRRRRSDCGPYAAAKWRRKGPQGGREGSRPVGCQSRDGLSANPRSRFAQSEGRSPETVASGWPSLWLLSLTPGSCPPPCGPATLFAPLVRRSGHARESDSLAGRRVNTRHGCRAPKERASKVQSQWAPACAGATEILASGYLSDRSSRNKNLSGGLQ
jgi:hypothetical protein